MFVRGIAPPAGALLLAVVCLSPSVRAVSPPAPVSPASVVEEYERTLAAGTDPATALTRARRRFAAQPDSLAAAAGLLVALDEPSLRKTHLDEVVAAADSVIALVEAQGLDPEPRTQWLADALYRKGRALGYMELPDVLAVRKIEDPEGHDEQFEATFGRLDALVDTTRPEFILLRVRRERRRGRFDEALRLLEIYRRTSPDPRWYEKKRRDILHEAEAAAR